MKNIDKGYYKYYIEELKNTLFNLKPITFTEYQSTRDPNWILKIYNKIKNGE